MSRTSYLPIVKPVGFLLAALLALVDARVALASRPIVAVFDVQAPFPEKLRGALTELIATQLVAGGAYLALPPAQIKRRLRQYRKESYKHCYDRSCQIEIGKELSANKSLATRISPVGDQCVLTMTLYDLRTSTAEAAKTSRVGCNEASVVAAVDAAAKALGKSLRGTTARAGQKTETDSSLTPRVRLLVRSTPGMANILVDGVARGKTPKMLTLIRGRRVIVDVARDGFKPARQEVVGGEQTTLDVNLSLTEAARLDLATASEWVGAGAGLGVLAGRQAYSIQVRLATFKWQHFFWTVAELGMLVGKDRQTGQSDRRFLIGSRAGYPLYFGERGEHQLLLGLGAATILSDQTDSNAPLLALSPGIEYLFSVDGGTFTAGFAVRAFLPLQNQDGKYPAMLTVSINAGFSISRWLTGNKGSRISARTGPLAPRRRQDGAK